MRAENQLRTFLALLKEYPAETPLYKFLPGYFRLHKKMGSTDRKVALRLVYNYFRLGKALVNHPPEERLFAAEFLCNNQENSFLSFFKPELAAQIAIPAEEKIFVLQKEYPDFKLEDVFPFTGYLSAGIDQILFLQSFFIQPDLFIRIQKGHEFQVKQTLAAADVVFRQKSEQCLALPNGTKLDRLFPMQRYFEVQDESSQLTAQYFQPKKWENWWDACAASGGKTLLLHEQEPDLKLVVSDIRESVLDNLDERLQLAGIKKYQKKLLDLTQNPDPILHDYAFDGIILDAPCTGSGTWGRTPEMINQFNASRISFFQQLQKTIALNVVKYLNPGKPLIYITCSAFSEENEDVVNYLVKEARLTLESSELLKGYERKSDTMFVARLIKNL
ncbi:RsmB/NOP family class I SAM-dependent RNA methyltransferase [Mucilaginibacter arboris]|uniref:RsmB/NOP family class I SAM-dependent RNA methyltransferase n=1 Tax=Mucilaginibacter arboris TaxID=2682090 RepID=A0A7K1T267_9SPHI|nr:RsmB/NOP family class I SAM-dependent RNA methyltransferase [Mucilaginibacter arboris]MVN23390.1 RsmB/NOP family class I SAM-dependent RNA methyltransferase [Mucilaginibacter arboris]